MRKFLFGAMLFLPLMFASLCQAQTTTKFDLRNLLDDDKLVASANQHITAFENGGYRGIALTGIVWLKNISFSTGSIDVDLKGKDVLQQSFLGIAFHGVDTGTYDAVYFRPFNFRSTDTLRKKHCVQYMSAPDFHWERLRKEHPLMYENTILPPPRATAWFHAHIVVDENQIKVYVNQSSTPSLVVKKLNTRTDGLIGLWNDGLNGSFANLVISSAK